VLSKKFYRKDESVNDQIMRQLEKIIEYGSYLLIFILPWQTRWIIRAGELNGGSWEYGTISLYAVDILLLILLVLFICLLIFKLRIKNYELRIKNRLLNYPNVSKSRLKRSLIFKYFFPQREIGAKDIFKSKRQSIWWLIAGLNFFVFISIFLAADKWLSLFCYLRFLSGIGLFWLIVKANSNKFKLIISLVLGIFLQAGLGIWQFFSQSTFADKWLGLALHDPSQLGVSVIETFSGARWLRAYGGLDHPNMLGGLLVIGILLLIYLLLNNKKLNYELRIKNYRTEYFFIYSLLFIFLLALFFTFSRGAWMAVIVGILTVFVSAIIKNDWLAQKKILKVILFTGVFIFIFTSIYSDLISARVSSANRLEIKSDTERIESYKTGFKIIKNHWPFGSGIGNYTLAVHNEIDKTQPSYFYQPAHDLFILVFSEIGIFGFLFFIFLLVVLIFNFKFEILNECLNLKIHKLINYFKISEYYKNDKYTNFLKFSLVASLFILFTVDHWWWSLHFGVLLFWFIIGLISKVYNENN
jgi:O-antigen ligase